MKQSNTCGFESMVMSIKGWLLHIRNPRVHIPTDSNETVGLSTYKLLQLILYSMLLTLPLQCAAVKDS